MAEKKIPGVGRYGGPAGGWGALQAVAKAIQAQMAIARDTRALRRMNQPEGFDCPGCAWPDPKHTSSFEFCENGAKAVAWETTAKRATPAFFADHTVSELTGWADHDLEDAGRLTHPMAYDAATDRYLPLNWEEAFARIGAALRALPHPDRAEFYTSGRASNEAAFLYQLFVRAYGTNNFPDCSNMCHEATSVGLPKSIGVGKGTVTLEDFDHADAVFCIGHNPGTNHPRMLSTLRDVARRKKPIIVFNPLRERGLERFANPQSPVEMLTGGSTKIAAAYYQVKVGGDLALLKGLMKALVEADAAAGGGVLDHAFIAEHTHGFEALKADLEAAEWSAIERASGLGRDAIEDAARVYAAAERVIICYGMGITQHRHGTENVQQLANLLLLRGNIGKAGAGICPLRGHSNVQGDRTVGITEAPSPALLDGIERVFGFSPPRAHGHGAVQAAEAIVSGEARAFVALGGNFPVAMSDPEPLLAAFRALDLTVGIATKLNRSHLVPGRESFILPCLGRTEEDLQEAGPQSSTVEDSMSVVHASRGTLSPASEELRSEPWIVAEMARATLPDATVDWRWLIADYDRIRDRIEAVFPEFADFNRRVREPGGFRLPIPAGERVWKTETGKANFLVADGIGPLQDGALILATIRSHDQYNTTIYGYRDRYRGIDGRRDIVFVHPADLAAAGLAHGDVVDVVALPRQADDGIERVVRGLTVVAYDIAPGSAAAYYPEANPLIALGDYDRASGTPNYKSIRIALRPAAAPAVAAE